MSVYVKVRVRVTFWSSQDAIPYVRFESDDDDVFFDNFISNAYYVSGPPRGLLYIGSSGTYGMVGDEAGPVDEEYVFLVPDDMVQTNRRARVEFQFGYHSYEISIYTSIDGVSYDLNGSGTSVEWEGNTLYIPLSGETPPEEFIPCWTDYNNTQEFP